MILIFLPLMTRSSKEQIGLCIVLDLRRTTERRPLLSELLTGNVE